MPSVYGVHLVYFHLMPDVRIFYQLSFWNCKCGVHCIVFSLFISNNYHTDWSNQTLLIWVGSCPAFTVRRSFLLIINPFRYLSYCLLWNIHFVVLSCLFVPSSENSFTQTTFYFSLACTLFFAFRLQHICKVAMKRLIV